MMRMARDYASLERPCTSSAIFFFYGVVSLSMTGLYRKVKEWDGISNCINPTSRMAMRPNLFTSKVD